MAVAWVREASWTRTCHLSKGLTGAYTWKCDDLPLLGAFQNPEWDNSIFFMTALILVKLECVPQDNKDGVVHYSCKMKVAEMVMEEMKQAFYNDHDHPCTVSLMTF